MSSCASDSEKSKDEEFESSFASNDNNAGKAAEEDDDMPCLVDKGEDSSDNDEAVELRHHSPEVYRCTFSSISCTAQINPGIIPTHQD